MRYRAIHEHDRCYPIRLMCRALVVSPVGYYAWRVRPESRRRVADRALLIDIRMIHQERRQTYGSPSLRCALVRRGQRVGGKCVARLMRQGGIRAKTVKKWRVSTPVPAPVPRSHQHPELCVYGFGDLHPISLTPP
jgi:hypothetical protein